MDWKTEIRKLKDLRQFEGNPRTATDKQRKDLDKSLEKFNLADPLVVNTDGEIIGGNFRYRRLLDKHGEDYEIDVRVPEEKLNQEQAKELNLRLNKNQGQWSEELLAEFGDEDLLSEVGFNDKEIDDLIGARKEEIEDDVPELKENKDVDVKEGDIYKLGEHRIMCGDANDKDNVKKLLEGQEIKTIFTSPPYNMGADMYENYSDDMKSEKYIDFNLSVVNKWKEYLKGYLFWNLSYNKNTRWEFLKIMSDLAEKTGLRFLEMIVWDKKTAMPIRSKDMLTRTYEPILLIGDEEQAKQDIDVMWFGTVKQRANLYKNDFTGYTNYWKVKPNKIQLENLKACYPVEIPSKGIIMTTEKGDIVADPFLGSGTTLIAAEKLGRKCYGMELNSKYIDVIIERWENYTNQEAEKL